MNLEVELRAAVTDVASVEERLKACGAEFIRNYTKIDEYYILKNSPRTGVRVRMDNNSCVVTHKEKRIEAGIERNAEREFHVDNPATFRYFLKISGYREQIRKQKNGSEWTLNESTVELSEVCGLGWYVEIEKILPGDADEFRVAEAGRSVKSVLALLGISDSAIEERSYTSMLKTVVAGNKT